MDSTRCLERFQKEYSKDFQSILSRLLSLENVVTALENTTQNHSFLLNETQQTHSELSKRVSSIETDLSQKYLAAEGLSDDSNNKSHNNRSMVASERPIRRQPMRKNIAPLTEPRRKLPRQFRAAVDMNQMQLTPEPPNDVINVDDNDDDDDSGSGDIFSRRRRKKKFQTPATKSRKRRNSPLLMTPLDRSDDLTRMTPSLMLPPNQSHRMPPLEKETQDFPQFIIESTPEPSDDAKTTDSAENGSIEASDEKINTTEYRSYARSRRELSESDLRLPGDPLSDDQATLPPSLGDINDSDNDNQPSTTSTTAAAAAAAVSKKIDYVQFFADLESKAYLGSQCISNKEFKSASDHLQMGLNQLKKQMLLERVPKSQREMVSQMFNNLAICKSKLVDFEAAMDAAKSASVVCPDWHKPHSTLGAIYVMQKRFNEGVKQFKIAIDKCGINDQISKDKYVMRRKKLLKMQQKAAVISLTQQPPPPKRRRFNDDTGVSFKSVSSSISPYNGSAFNGSGLAASAAVPKPLLKRKSSSAGAPPTIRQPTPFLSPQSSTEGIATRKQKLSDKLRLKTVDELKEILRINVQKTSGKKEELIQRCVDGVLFGAIPFCPQCDGRGVRSNLKYDTQTGEYICVGHFDPKLRRKVDCGFRSTSVARTPWKIFGMPSA